MTQRLYILKHMTLYHLSESNHDGETFAPRQMPKWRAMEGENWRAKRICVSNSIDGALTAILSCDSQPFGKHLFVHVPENLDELLAKKKVYKPSSKQIPDVEATNELWLKAPAKMRCIGEIEVLDIDEKADVSYIDKSGNKVPLDKFIWKWMQKVV